MDNPVNDEPEVEAGVDTGRKLDEAELDQLRQRVDLIARSMEEVMGDLRATNREALSAVFTIALRLTRISIASDPVWIKLIQPLIMQVWVETADPKKVN